MKISIIELSKREHELVENAASEYGPIFVNAHDIVFFTVSFIFSITPEAYSFSLFLSQVHKCLILCLLSAVRNHDIQFHMMLRQVLEYAALGSYSLDKHAPSVFYKKGDDGLLYPKECANNKAYKWLERNYNEHSDKLKSMKEVINQTFAHASILPTTQNLYIEKDWAVGQFFDSPDKLITKQRIWWVGNVGLGIIDLFYKVSKKFPLISVGL